MYLPAVLLLFAIAVISHYFNISVSFFTSDPMAIAERHPLTGFVSNIGAVIWSFSLAVSIFTYVLLKTNEARNNLNFILLGGIISLIMLLDDFFMLHENIFPVYVGIDEKITFSLYGILALFYLIKFRKKIMETAFAFLLLAGLFFMLSVFIDLQSEPIGKWHYLFEDGLKLLGIVSWFAYQFTVCLNEINSAISEAGKISKYNN